MLPRSVRMALGGALVALAALAGCGAVTDGQRVVDRSRLVNELANRLSHAGSGTYTAIYTLPEGGSASIAQAQEPTREAYTYPSGKVVITPEYTADCRTSGTRTTCTLTPPPSPTVADPSTALMAEMGTKGMIAPTLVVTLLTAAALDSNAVINQHDTTIAGENATCVDVSGVDNAASSQFSACITTGGLLGSFTGTVSDTDLDVSLDRYDTTVTGDAFALPTGAATVDKRPH